jgi:hypothetical protein
VWTPAPAAMESVSSGIKRKAASVATTPTSFPASLRRRITPGVLYAAMPPVIPTSTLATQVVYRAGTDENPGVGGVQTGGSTFAGLDRDGGLTRGPSTRTFFGMMRNVSYYILTRVCGLAGPSTERGDIGGRRA